MSTNTQVRPEFLKYQHPQGTEEIYKQFQSKFSISQAQVVLAEEALRESKTRMSSFEVASEILDSRLNAIGKLLKVCEGLQSIPDRKTLFLPESAIPRGECKHSAVEMYQGFLMALDVIEDMLVYEYPEFGRSDKVEEIFMFLRDGIQKLLRVLRRDCESLGYKSRCSEGVSVPLCNVINSLVDDFLKFLNSDNL